MILGAFDIKYMPHTTIKGQVLVDFMAEFIEHPRAGVTGGRGINKSVGCEGCGQGMFNIEVLC